MEMLPTQNSGWWLAVSPRHKTRDHVWAYHPSAVYLYRLTSSNGSMILETHCCGNRLTTWQSRLLLYPVSACVAAHEWRALAARLWGKRSENASTIPACKIAIQLIALTNHGKGNYRKRTLENVDTPRPNGWATFMSTIYAFGEDCGVKLSTQEHTRKTMKNTTLLTSHKMFIEVHHNILYIIRVFQTSITMSIQWLSLCSHEESPVQNSSYEDCAPPLTGVAPPFCCQRINTWRDLKVCNSVYHFVIFQGWAYPSSYLNMKHSSTRKGPLCRPLQSLRMT